MSVVIQSFTIVQITLNVLIYMERILVAVKTDLATFHITFSFQEEFVRVSNIYRKHNENKMFIKYFFLILL